MFHTNRSSQCKESVVKYFQYVEKIELFVEILSYQDFEKCEQWLIRNYSFTSVLILELYFIFITGEFISNFFQ